MRSHQSRVGTESNVTNVLVKRGNLDADTHSMRTVREDEGRDRGDAGEAEELQRLPANHQKPEESLGHFLLHSPQKEPTSPMP